MRGRKACLYLSDGPVNGHWFTQTVPLRVGLGNGDDKEAKR